MRPIKFRGKCKKNGEVVFGYLVQYRGRPAIITDVGELIVFAITKKRLNWLVEVYPETVAQLVGYDADGNEIYSDDKVIEQFFPEQFPMKRIAGDRIPANRFGEKFDCFKLKK